MKKGGLVKEWKNVGGYLYREIREEIKGINGGPCTYFFGAFNWQP